MRIVGMAISQFVDSLIMMIEEEFREASASQEEEEEAIQFEDRAIQAGKIQRRRRLELMHTARTFLVLLVIGTVVSALGHPWKEDDGSPWVNGFYSTIVTLTTVDVGDISPDWLETEGWEKVFTSVMMLVGVPVFGWCLHANQSVLFGEMREVLKLRLVAGGLTDNKFEKFNDFSIELANAGGMNDSSDGKISRFEFLTFVLVENGIIQLKDISSVMQNFREIDKTGTGYIEERDLDAWMKEHAAELHSLKKHSHPGEKVHPVPNTFS